MIRISTIFIAICMVLVAASLGLTLYSLAGISGMESAIVALTALTFLILYNAVSMRLLDRTSAADLQHAILEALERDVPHPNAVRLALERRREQRGDAPQVAVVLPAHVQARDAPVQPHALETYDQLKERSDD